MFCRGCHYDLRGSVRTQRCPECGAVFDPADPATYLTALPRPRSTLEQLVRVFWIVVIGLVVAFVVQTLAAVPSSGH